MKVLDMTNPIGLNQIYTNVNILKKITSSQIRNIQEILHKNNPEKNDFYRLGFGQIAEEKVSGTEAANLYPRLMILGKPGAGKTTFLKHLAIHCINDQFQPNRVPFLITLREFAEEKSQPSLLQYIAENLFEKFKIDKSDLEYLLKHGKLLLLLDGLDEVREEDEKRVINEIQKLSSDFFFSNRYYEDLNFHKNKFKENQKNYNKIKDNLKKAEKQFKASEKNLNRYNEGSRKYKENLSRHKDWRKKLEEIQSLFKREEQKFIEECEKYPDLEEEPDEGLTFLRTKFPDRTYTNHFIITCRIAAWSYKFIHFTDVEIADFEKIQIKDFSEKWFKHKDPTKSSKFMDKLSLNPRVEELASNPLLLTLLCLVFEVNADFSSNRSELYKEGIFILLKKWDGQRDIKREQIYQNLDTPRKENLLSQIAMSTFEQGNYFFKQEYAEHHILKYICNLPEFIKNSEKLKPDSGELVLKSIEAQHGLLVERAKRIYSFSHLTFHEYFTAHKIVKTSEPKKLEEELKKLASHISEKRWREVLLLSLEMVENASYLFILIKEEIDSILVNDEKLQQILEQIESSSRKMQRQYKLPALRAFLLARTLALQNNLNLCSYFASNLDSALNQASKITTSLTKQRSDKPFGYYFAFVEDLVKKFKDLFVRTFNDYQKLAHKIDLASAIDSSLPPTIELKHQIDIESKLDKVLRQARAIAETNRSKFKFNQILFSALALSLYFAFYNAMNLSQSLAPELMYNLQKLKEKLPFLETQELNEETQELNKWLRLNGKNWINRFRTTVRRYSDICTDLQLDERQTELIQNYYNANLLLVDLLSSKNFYMDGDVRQKIEDTMLLPSRKISS